MKKIICLVAAAVLSATAFCAEHTLGLGLTFPVSSLKLKYKSDYGNWSGTMQQKDIGLDLTYLLILDNAISIKSDFYYSKISSNKYKNPDTSFGLMFDAGVGYTFPINGNFTLSALGMFGINLANYLWEYPKETFSISLLTFDIGTDVIGKYKFTNHLGAFANLGLRYSIDLGSAYDGTSNVLKTSGIRFIPTIGASWTF